MIEIPDIPTGTNVVGIGIDSIEVNRIKDSLDRHGENFLNRIFTAARHRAKPIPGVSDRRRMDCAEKNDLSRPAALRLATLSSTASPVAPAESFAAEPDMYLILAGAASKRLNLKSVA